MVGVLIPFLLQVTGDGVKKVASSGSEHGFVSHGSDLNSGRLVNLYIIHHSLVHKLPHNFMLLMFHFFRSNKKRLFSSSRQSGSSLPPVAEDFPWDHSDPNYKLTELNENDLPETGALPFSFPLKLVLKLWQYLNT